MTYRAKTVEDDAVVIIAKVQHLGAIEPSAKILNSGPFISLPLEKILFPEVAAIEDAFSPSLGF